MSNCGVPGHVTGNWEGKDLSSWRCLDCHEEIRRMKTATSSNGGIVIVEPMMYPAPDGYEEDFDDFEELKTNAQKQFSGYGLSLNFPFSWWIFDERHEDWGSEEDRHFLISLALPRKASFTTWKTKVFDREEVEQWIEKFIRPTVMRWYGWEEKCCPPSLGYVKKEEPGE